MTKPSRFLCIGPGGKKCSCCFPAPGSKDRRAQFRSAKRKDAKETLRLLYLNEEI